MERRIVYRALKTPDGTILETLYGHDFKTYTDKNGKWYMIDGGPDEYGRSSVNHDEEFITLYSDDPYEKLRQHVRWGSLKGWIKLCDLEADHLEAILVYPRVTSWMKRLLEQEKQYRKI